ncbi:MAG: acetate/propionate family kinase [Planctomycetota bacterium]
MTVLVLNVGSTTLKYACFDSEASERIASGVVDRIGEPNSATCDHAAAAEQALAAVADFQPEAIGHRIVHGGARFHEPTRVTPQVLEELKALDTLAPLHNPPARRVVESLTHLATPQTLVFDTAYYGTLPEVAHRYALPESLLRDHGVRRYGFHGTSHQYVTEQVLAMLDGDSSDKRVITLHLGGGASATASVGGRAVDTSMGMTPLEGLVMATRSGDLDPAIPLHLMRVVGMSAEEVERCLNKQSGLTGICGEGDMRAILQRCDHGDASAQLAIDMYVRKLQKTIGGFIAILGGLDALVFTGGVGEHAAPIRERVTDGLDHFGIAIDSDANATNARDITAGLVRVLVVPTDEELAIARLVFAG